MSTDYDWYRFLSTRPDLDEANFWKPSGGQSFKALRRGEPLIFKLKAAHRHAIVGFGLFTLFQHMSVYDAWHLFGDATGAPGMDAVVERVGKYVHRGEMQRPSRSHTIGCILLASPIFFEKPLWIRAPADWKNQIVAGKTYSLDHGEGRRIWQECLARAAAIPLPESASENLGRIQEVTTRGQGYYVEPRLGQGLFRLSVTQHLAFDAASPPKLGPVHTTPEPAVAVENGVYQGVRSEVWPGHSSDE